MTKVLMIILGLLLGLNCYSQTPGFDNYYLWPIDDKTNKIVFSGSTYMPGAHSDTLFSAAKQFLSNSFKNERDTLVYVDTASNIIVSRGSFNINLDELGERGKGYVTFTIQLECRYRSYKYLLTNFEHFAATPGGLYGGPLENDMAAIGGRAFPIKYWNQAKAKCYYMIQNTIERLKETMTKAAPDI